MLSACLLGAALAFAPPSHIARHSHLSHQQPVSMMAKGFGAPKPAPKPKASKPKSTGAVARDQASQDLEKLKAQGNPEYMVLIREVPEGAAPSNWYPVGGMAVPRSSSIDVALSLAIFQNEDDLLKGAFRNHPFLSKSTHKFEYGYRLKEFPDDPVKVADPNAAEPSTNPLVNWFNALDSGLNDGSGWGNPLSRN